MRGAQGCDGSVAALSLRSVLMRVVVSAARVRRRRGIFRWRWAEDGGGGCVGGGRSAVVVSQCGNSMRLSGRVV